MILHDPVSTEERLGLTGISLWLITKLILANNQTYRGDKILSPFRGVKVTITAGRVYSFSAKRSSAELSLVCNLLSHPWAHNLISAKE